MRNYEHITIKLEAVPDMGQRKGLTSHPYRVLELVRRKRTQSRERNRMPNRTIIKFKRRQGTHAGRKGAVARPLKQISLDTYHTRKRRQCIQAGIRNERPHAIGESGFSLPGSMRMACRERDVRNLGKTRDLPEELGNQIRRVGGTTKRSEPIRPTGCRSSRKRQGKPPAASRKARTE